MDSSSERKCASCGKAPSPDQPLSTCSRCKKASYCGKDCQSKDWPVHKKACPKPEPMNYFDSIKDEQDCYGRIIDCFRLHCEDEYTSTGEGPGLYNEQDPVPAFKEFLREARKANMLPKWWDLEKRDACLEKAKSKNDSKSIYFAVEARDLTEHYGNPLEVMQLRAAARIIYQAKRDDMLMPGF